VVVVVSVKREDYREASCDFEVRSGSRARDTKIMIRTAYACCPLVCLRSFSLCRRTLKNRCGAFSSPMPQTGNLPTGPNPSPPSVYKSDDKSPYPSQKS
jgi:hypothetical protein